MKKFSLLTILLLFSAFICLGAGTALGASNGYITSSNLDVNLTNQNPDTARPGEPVELTVSVQNVGNDDVKDISVKVNPEYPFSAISGESLEKSISYLNARQDEDEGGVLKFKLLTDSNASAGTYNVDIVTTYKSSGSSSTTYTTTKTVQIEVRGKEYAQIVTIDKANIDIAKEETLEFIVTNTGTSPLKNMVVSWTDPKGVILPIYSDNTKYIKYLDAGESVNITYNVMADVNADPGLYTLDITLNMEDYDSNETTINTTAGVFVGGETDFDVSFSESDAGEISLSVANVGNNIAYSVKVSIPDQDNYQVSGSSSTIVGNLEKGDYTIASFDVSNKQSSGGVPGSQGAPGEAQAAEQGNLTAASTENNPLKVQIEYTDAKGERITVDKEVELEMTAGNMTTAQSGGPGNSGGISSYLPYIAVIVLAAGAFVYRKKIQERVRLMKEKKSGNKKKPEEQKSGLEAQ